MNCNILPVVYPPINAFPHQGALFSVLFAREECKPWIFNNFIQIYSLKDLYKNDLRSGTIDFYYNMYGDWMNFYIKANPWIKFNSIPFEFIKSSGINFIEFIKSSINGNCYLFFDVDTYYISEYKYWYMESHTPHDIFIYGYDDEKKLFYMGDNTIGKYCHGHVTYEELLISLNTLSEIYSGTNEEIFCHSYREKAFNLIKVKKNVERSGENPLFQKEIFGININKIINDLKEYLLWDNYGEGYRHSDFYVYGIDCYNELEKFIYYAMETNQEVDYRALYSFIEHKKLMLLRIQYLCNEYGLNILMDKYTILVQNFNLLMKIVLKANIKVNNSKDLWQKAINLLEKFRYDEIILLNEFITKVE
ncbi:hypothetical protein DFR58_12168 [Anaerobacterium chartisolvens]|uniref:Butirosin biosynthesis protein H-like n=1 Tax=Anaerobacterium chartisolvens TaxID=1297424 RepID=A0A369AYN6_9FIRM|nr:hypothetical protein [Anaerobacterium chartisolvens]RCX12564.1 hypothetical protein DFR58_12168 [Anaerobacterium chartisolvens]